MKYLFIFIFSLSMANGYSQVWIDSGAKWSFDYFNVAEYGTWQFEYTHDTLIDGHQSQAIKATKYMYQSFGYVAAQNGGTFYTYSSNDSVFYFKNGQFFLLYDFGAHIGDSWILSIDPGSPCSDTSVVHVIDTGLMVINDQTYRTITVQSDSNAYQALNGLCVEHIGIVPLTYEDNNFGFLPGYQYCPDFIPEYDLLIFRCYEDNSFPTYNPTDKNCDTLTTIGEKYSKKLNFFPNPTSHYLNIDLPKKNISSISIIDVNGRYILEYQSVNKIDVSQLKNGIYFVRIITSDDLYFTRTFVKE